MLEIQKMPTISSSVNYLPNNCLNLFVLIGIVVCFMMRFRVCYRVIIFSFCPPTVKILVMPSLKLLPPGRRSSLVIKRLGVTSGLKTSVGMCPSVNPNLFLRLCKKRWPWMTLTTIVCVPMPTLLLTALSKKEILRSATCNSFLEISPFRSLNNEIS